MRLSTSEKKLCNLLQDGLPICKRPFADIAVKIGCDRQKVIKQLKGLEEARIIRRISALINYRALGKSGTLVAAHIPKENLAEAAEAINALEGVSHNYLRQHHYNLWFTLQADSPEQIADELKKLSLRFGIDFRSVPAVRIFKLDTRFDAEGGGQVPAGDLAEPPIAKPVDLNAVEKKILSALQRPLEIIEQPFDFLTREAANTDNALEVIKGLCDKGVIRRIAAIVDHRKLGFAANVLFAAAVEADRIDRAGVHLSRFGIVSHCYQRKPLPDWPFNLYAMMHGRSMGQIQHVIDKFTKAEQIESFELLPTEAELKRRPVIHKFQ